MQQLLATAFNTLYLATPEGAPGERMTEVILALLRQDYVPDEAQPSGARVVRIPETVRFCCTGTALAQLVEQLGAMLPEVPPLLNYRQVVSYVQNLGSTDTKKVEELAELLEELGGSSKSLPTWKQVLDYVHAMDEDERESDLVELVTLLDGKGYHLVPAPDDVPEHLPDYEGAGRAFVDFRLRSDHSAADMMAVEPLQALLNELGVEDALRALTIGKGAVRG